MSGIKYNNPFLEKLEILSQQGCPAPITGGRDTKIKRSTLGYSEHFIFEKKNRESFHFLVGIEVFWGSKPP